VTRTRSRSPENRAAGFAREADLYPPLKAHLEAQGYEVKAEIGACDILARRGAEPPVVVEMKLRLTLNLVLQAVARQTVFAHVYIAVPRGRDWRARSRDVLRLCRRLGLGLITLRPGSPPLVETHLDPGPYRPRLNGAKAERLLREFERRQGDPNTGGSAASAGRVTAYRQDALRCAEFLSRAGAARGAAVAAGSGVALATRMMARNHHGWFERVERGVYALTPAGEAALLAHADLVRRITEVGNGRDGAREPAAVRNRHER